MCGPPWKTVVAKTGISTEYGTPTRLTSASSRMIERIGPEAERVAEAFRELLRRALPSRCRRRVARAIRITQQRDDHGDVADAVDEEAPAFARRPR